MSAIPVQTWFFIGSTKTEKVGYNKKTAPQSYNFRCMSNLANRQLMDIITVRLEVISYGGWENLEVAIDVEPDSKKHLYLTYPTAQTILNYEIKSWEEKAKSKSLEVFLGKALSDVKKTGRIINKITGSAPRVALMSLDHFLAIAIWESSANKNIEITQLLATGFGESFLSTAYEQLKIKA